MQKGKIATKNFVLLMAVQTCDLLTYNMITPVVAKYATLEGAALADAGIIAGAFALVAIIARPLGGFAADRLRRKRLVAVAVAASCVALLGYAASPNLAVFLVFRVVHGVAYAVFGTAITSMALMFVPEERKAEGMGYFSWSYVFASACGPALGVAVGDALGYHALFLSAGLLTLACLALVAAVDDVAPCKTGPSVSSGKIRVGDFFSIKALPFMLIIACFSVNWGCISTFMVMTGDARGVSGIALFFTANALALLVTRPPAGRFADRHGIAALFYPACFFEAAAMALLAFAGQLWLFLVIAALKALGQGTVHPALQVESVKSEAPERSGVAMATFLLGTDIGYGIGPVYGGFMCAHFGFGGMYLACLPVTALALALFVAWRARSRRVGKTGQGDCDHG